MMDFSPPETDKVAVENTDLLPFSAAQDLFWMEEEEVDHFSLPLTKFSFWCGKQKYIALILCSPFYQFWVEIKETPILQKLIYLCWQLQENRSNLLLSANWEKLTLFLFYPKLRMGRGQCMWVWVAENGSWTLLFSCRRSCKGRDGYLALFSLHVLSCGRRGGSLFCSLSNLSA